MKEFDPGWVCPDEDWMCRREMETRVESPDRVLKRMADFFAR